MKGSEGRLGGSKEDEGGRKIGRQIGRKRGRKAGRNRWWGGSKTGNQSEIPRRAIGMKKGRERGGKEGGKESGREHDGKANWQEAREGHRVEWGTVVEREK